MSAKYTFIFSLPILVIWLLSLVGVIEPDESYRTSNIILVALTFFTLIAGFILWYQMLAESFRKRRGQFFV